MGKARDTLAEFAREEAIVRKIERVMRSELRGVDPRWIEQAFSPLGPRKHIAAVRRRIAEAEATGKTPADVGAAVLGRRYLLTQESVAEEINRSEALKPPKRITANDVSEEDAAYAAFMARRASRRAGGQQ